MKKRLLIVLFLLVSFSVFSLSVSYIINVEGKTDPAFLQEKIGMPEIKEYESLEKAVTAAEKYKQKIINLRLYTYCDYSMNVEEDESAATAVFNVVDAKSFVVLPYPKYDSNEGLSIKIKAVDKNFRGKFGYYDASLVYENQEGVRKGSVLLNANNIVVGRTTFSGSLDTTVNFASIQESSLDFSLKSLIKFDKFSLTPAISVEDIKLNSFDDSETTFSLLLSDLSLGKFDIKASESITFAPKANTSVFNIDNICSKIKLDRKKVCFSDTLKYYPEVSKHLMNNDFVFDYKFTDTIAAESEIITKTYFADRNKNNIQLTQGVKFVKKSKDLSVALSLADNELIYTETKKHGNFISAGAEVESDKINYVQDDFRFGLDYSVSADFKKMVKSDVDDFTNYFRTRAEVVWFPLNNRVFNPSFRIIGSYSAVPFKTFCKDPGYGIDYRDTEDLTTPMLSECLRGIRDYNTEAKKLPSMKAFLLMNMNLTFKFISIGDFIDTYATGFCDIALMSETPENIQETGIHKLVTVGCEGIGILRQFPSYPVRASFGVNLDSLCYGEKDKLEYEIFFGLYHFF